MKGIDIILKKRKKNSEYIRRDMRFRTWNATTVYRIGDYASEVLIALPAAFSGCVVTSEGHTAKTTTRVGQKETEEDKVSA